MVLPVLWCLTCLNVACAVQTLGRSVFRQHAKAVNHTEDAVPIPAVHLNGNFSLQDKTATWIDLGSPWLKNDSQLAKVAVQRGFNFLVHVASQQEHVILNTVSFFTELAETSSDPEVRAKAREPAIKAANAVGQRMLRAWRHGTFGQFFGTRHDVIEGLQLLRYQVDLGLIQPKARATEGSLLFAIRDAWLDCDSCRTSAPPTEGESLSARGAAKQYLSLLDGVVGASIVDEGSFLFGLGHGHPQNLHAPKGLLAQAFANAIDPFCSLDDEDDFAPGSADWRAKAYLATHLVFVAAGFDRFLIPAGPSALNNVFVWLRRESAEALNRVDDNDHGIELLSEFVAALKAANATEDGDSFIRKSARTIIQRQHDDGRWGLQKEATDAAQDYNILHHVWTAMSALRGRRTIDSAYAQHLHSELLKGSRIACSHLNGVGKSQ